MDPSFFRAPRGCPFACVLVATRPRALPISSLVSISLKMLNVATDHFLSSCGICGFMVPRSRNELGRRWRHLGLNYRGPQRGQPPFDRVVDPAFGKFRRHAYRIL